MDTALPILTRPSATYSSCSPTPCSCPLRNVNIGIKQKVHLFLTHVCTCVCVCVHYLIPSQDIQHSYSSPRKWHAVLSQLLAEKVSIDFILLHCFFVEVLSLQVRLSSISYVTLLKHLLNL